MTHYQTIVTILVIAAQMLQINENHKLLKKFNNYLAKNISMLVCLPQAEMKAFRSQFRGQRNVEFSLFRLTNIYDLFLSLHRFLPWSNSSFCISAD
jgi:hypothetical protein